jgi:N-terminal domain of anti-restriction factor ArdC
MLISSKERIRTVRQAIWAGVQLVAHDIEHGHPEVLSKCLLAMARFHTYSFGNVLLIATQRPTATQVAGWRGWNELGRRIKQGEKGILIYAPILSEHTKADSDSEQPQQELLGFRPVRVFDVAQTEGEELSEPSLLDNLDLAATLAKLMESAGSQGIKIDYSDNIAPAKATSYRGMIRLLPDMEAVETISVFVRELAVQMLYETQRRSYVTRDVLLREARAVTFVVGNALAFETELAENIQLYRGNQNLLAESLQSFNVPLLSSLGHSAPRTDRRFRRCSNERRRSRHYRGSACSPYARRLAVSTDAGL